MTRDNLRVVVVSLSLTSIVNQLKTIFKCMNFLSIMKFQLSLMATKADKIPRGKWNSANLSLEKTQFDKNDHFITSFHLSRDGYDEAWRIRFLEL